MLTLHELVSGINRRSPRLLPGAEGNTLDRCHGGQPARARGLVQSSNALWQATAAAWRGPSEPCPRQSRSVGPTDPCTTDLASAGCCTSLHPFYLFKRHTSLFRRGEQCAMPAVLAGATARGASTQARLPPPSASKHGCRQAICDRRAVAEGAGRCHPECEWQCLFTTRPFALMPRLSRPPAPEGTQASCQAVRFRTPFPPHLPSPGQRPPAAACRRLHSASMCTPHLGTCSCHHTLHISGSCVHGNEHTTSPAPNFTHTPPWG